VRFGCVFRGDLQVAAMASITAGRISRTLLLAFPIVRSKLFGVTSDVSYDAVTLLSAAAHAVSESGQQGRHGLRDSGEDGTPAGLHGGESDAQFGCEFVIRGSGERREQELLVGVAQSQEGFAIAEDDSSKRRPRGLIRLAGHDVDGSPELREIGDGFEDN